MGFPPTATAWAAEQSIPTRTDRAKNLKMGNGLNPDYDFWSFGKDGGQ